jgi:molybdenum cofactor cytidylyltransferase
LSGKCSEGAALTAAEIADSFSCTGILLAAGRGLRFDPQGGSNKLLQPFGDHDLVVTATAKTLLAVLPTVVAVVRPGADEVKSRLRDLGCQVATCPTADEGMGASLVHALSNARDADGWLIALGDMPFVQMATISALINAIRSGADIVVPTFHGRRGNPVAFSKVYLPELLQLGGDEGARRLLAALPVTEIAVEDEGIHRDIDTMEDIKGSGQIEQTSSNRNT